MMLLRAPRKRITVVHRFSDIAATLSSSNAGPLELYAQGGTAPVLVADYHAGAVRILGGVDLTQCKVLRLGVVDAGPGTEGCDLVAGHTVATGDTLRFVSAAGVERGDSAVVTVAGNAVSWVGAIAGIAAGDYAIAIGPNDGTLPLHWVTFRTSGGHDEFAVFLVASLFHHLRGNTDQARSCARSASECSKHLINRAADLRERRIGETRRSDRDWTDSYIRQNAGAMTQATWDAIGREHGWLHDWADRAAAAMLDLLYPETIGEAMGDDQSWCRTCKLWVQSNREQTPGGDFYVCALCKSTVVEHCDLDVEAVAAGLRMRAPESVNAAIAGISGQSAPADTCTDRPRPSCSRPDGQPLRQWDQDTLWNDHGEACDASEGA
jgi:hypothetical protein